MIVHASESAMNAREKSAKEGLKMMLPMRDHIPIGRENAITRAELAQMWRMTDREVREHIAKMRTMPTDDPYAIISSSHNPPGYWRSDVHAELERYIRETNARAANTIKAAGDAKRVLDHA